MKLGQAIREIRTEGSELGQKTPDRVPFITGEAATNRHGTYISAMQDPAKCGS
jgi:hypothetical protein